MLNLTTLLNKRVEINKQIQETTLSLISSIPSSKEEEEKFVVILIKECPGLSIQELIELLGFASIKHPDKVAKEVIWDLLARGVVKENGWKFYLN
jgi:predicted HTH transcriptional regulator